MDKKTDCTCEYERISDNLGILTHWYDESDAPRWPKLPKTLKYEMKHRSIPASPYCIYALVHDTFVTASSLTDKDKKKFCVYEVQNDCIFTDYAEKLKDTKAEATALREQLSLCHVVPKSYIDRELSSLQETIAEVVCPAVVRRNDTVLGFQIVDDLQNTIVTKICVKICNQRSSWKYRKRDN